uniref:Obscurin, cytoskeletal calmodulin and titin-interacting RhoGEF b n=1 Tax=Salmo trutta TaxID=8032 RepID=A0A674F057_SALTR
MKASLMDQNLFGGAPRFLTRPKACAVCVGKDATLSCTIVGNPTLLITWEKEKLRLTSGGRFKTVDDGNVYRLTIYDLTLEDSGLYMCRAKNNVGEAYACVTLHVGLPQEMVERAPVFMVKPTSARVGLGGDVVFHCRVAAYPEPKFDWDKDGRYLAETNRIKVSSDGDSSSLRIQSVRSLDSGMYTCRAQNSVGRSNSAAALVIDTQDSPLISQLPKSVFTRTCTVTEGKHAKLSCFVTGHPKPHIIWRKDGGNIGEGRRHIMYEDQAENFILKILYCKQSDNGLYTCNASNMAGQTYSAVLVIVKEPKVPFRRKLQDVEVQEKMTAMLLCEVPVSASQASWFMEETRLEDSSKYCMEEEGTMRRLTIRNVTTNDDAVYICEMKEGSRTVAELTVLGNIIKKLPRRTVVSVSDTVIFCVELEHPSSDAYWTRNGERLKPDTRISIACTLRQYTLTISHCQADDSGEVAFVAGDCKTSTRFSVAGEKHPPDPPIDVVVRNKTDSSITLHWSPPDSDRPVPIKGYMVERRKVGAQTWQRCNGMEISPFTEITIQNITEEASYQFRISAVNDYGQSQYMEVPGTFYLEPSAEVKTGLMNSTAISGEEASLSVDLSAVCSGFWSINGRLLRSGADYLITRQKTTHTLTIRTVLMEMNGAVIKFVGGETQQAVFTNKESVQKEVKATLSQKATLSCEVFDTKTEVKWYKDGKLLTSSKTVSMETKGKTRQLVIEKVEKKDAGEYTCEVGAVFTNKESVQKEVKATLSQKATLSCEVSDTKTEVKWYKDGKLLTSSKTVSMETKGKTRQLVIEKVEKKDAGEYTCEVGAEKLAAFTNKESVQKEVKATLSQKASLSCEVSDTKTEVKWYKDGKLLTSSKTVSMETKGKTRQLVIEKVEKKDGGEYTCEVGTEKLAAFSNKESVQKEVKATLSQKATLSCEVSDTKTEVKWYKDGKLLTSSKTVSMETKGKTRQLVIEKVEKKDAGEYTCEVGAEKVTFKIQVFSPKQRYVIPLSIMIKATLSCEVSDPKTELKWYKDGKLLTSSKTVSMETKGKTRQLVIEKVEKKDAGEYTCEVGAEKLAFKIQVSLQKEVKATLSQKATLSCEVSDTKTEVKWYKDGKLLTSSKTVSMETKGKTRQLVIEKVEKKDAGEYTCEVGAEKLVYKIQVAVVVPLDILSCEVSDTKTEVKWYKDGKLLTSSKTVSMETKGKTRQLVIEKVEKKDAGEYTCEVGAEKLAFKIEVAGRMSLTFNNICCTQMSFVQASEKIVLTTELTSESASVKWFRDGVELKESSKYDMKREGHSRTLIVKSTEVKDSGTYSLLYVSLQPVATELGGTLTLTCEMNRALGDVLWRHNSCEVKPGGRFCVSTDGPKRVLTVTGMAKEDEGEYSCECFVFIRFTTCNVAAVEGKEAIFKCSVTPADVKVKWFCNNVPITAGPKYKIEHGGTCHSLTITSVSQDNAQEISIDAEGKTCSATLQVQRKNQPPFALKVHYGEIAPVKLEVELSKPSKEVRWMKNSVVLQPGGNMEIRVDGAKQTLVFKSVTTADRGYYSCETLDDKTQAKLTVDGK